jgi:hypothetical protein
VTTHQTTLTLPDDGIIDLIAVEIAARGTRPVALTRAERQLAAARILAQGGTPALVSKRLHVNGTTALTLAARYRHNEAAARDEHHHRQAWRDPWVSPGRDLPAQPARRAAAADHGPGPGLAPARGAAPCR